MIEKFELSESKFGYQLNYSDSFPDFSLSQVREWIESMWLAMTFYKTVLGNLACLVF